MLQDFKKLQVIILEDKNNNVKVSYQYGFVYTIEGHSFFQILKIIDFLKLKYEIHFNSVAYNVYVLRSNSKRTIKPDALATKD